MDIAVTIVGAVIIVVGLVDMFRALLHPSGEGVLSNAVMSALWSVSRRVGHRPGSAVGPAGMVATVLVWVMMQGLGWALIYFPHIPGGFNYSPGIDPGRYPNLVEAIYVSLVTLATLGYGDVVAIQPWIRALAPVQALAGFALLTAALTWFMQIYPPLTRRRALALRLHGLAEADFAEALPGLPAETVTRVLGELAAEINVVSVDLNQHSETYYFQEENPRESLSRQLDSALELCDAAGARASAETGVGARMLAESLDNLAAPLRGFVRVGDEATARQIFRAYAEDHSRGSRDRETEGE
ncbi:potassium channel family protein [Dietzia sp. PP-33]|jgi:voltage-gated potassium channel Kch|uniref:potassium channel family protein n=1 Tax=Dietzia sp. PP-33 TaxID=2957500 RepID=UPI0029ABB1DF|nr:ion channel [Dietzia sp. PP-33]MDX2355364.1 ion channel [Dietzia sp. PP-33]